VKYNQALNDALVSFTAREVYSVEKATGAQYLQAQEDLRLSYFNQEYFIGYPKGQIRSVIKEEIDQSDQLMIIQYLNAQRRVYPTGKWISFLELPGGPNHYPPFLKRGIEPLANKFGEDLEGFIQAAQKLGGQEIKMGDKAFLIPAFPYLPLAVALWQADEEFPAQANILFDSSNLDYLPTASLYILGINLSFKLRGEKIISG